MFSHKTVEPSQSSSVQTEVKLHVDSIYELNNLAEHLVILYSGIRERGFKYKCMPHISNLYLEKGFYLKIELHCFVS